MFSSKLLIRILRFHILCFLCFDVTDSVEWIGLWRVKPVRSTSGKISKDRTSVQALPSQHLISNNEASKKKLTLLFNSGCANARKAGYLKGKQTKICQKYVDIMPYVALASLLTIKVCEDTFRFRRWNCVSLSLSPNLSADLTLGTREQAFVYSLASAAVAHGTAKACSSGSVLSCGCGRIPQEPPIGAFKWGGCGDNLRFGTKFSRLFVDSPWKMKKVKKEIVTFVNKHNNKAGRKILKESIARQCKCHGVSGSCNVMTCWQSLPKLLDIGERLMRKYQTAIEVAPSEDNLSHKIVPVNIDLKTELPPDQLIYITKSPDYCTPDRKVGSLGTYGRFCNSSSQDSDGCDSMCCGRGYESLTQEKIERCHCKYHWCCYVKCKTCRKLVQINQCN